MHHVLCVSVLLTASASLAAADSIEQCYRDQGCCGIGKVQWRRDCDALHSKSLPRAVAERKTKSDRGIQKQAPQKPARVSTWKAKP